MATVSRLTLLDSATTKDSRIEYGIKMAVLITLRAQQLPGGFQLFRRVAILSPSGDLVVRLTTGSDSVLAIVRLKYSDKKKFVDLQSFAPKQREGKESEGRFDLRKAFGVFERLQEIHQKQSHEVSQDEKFLRGIPLDKVFFFICTNKEVKMRQNEMSHEEEEMNKDIEELLNTNTQIKSLRFDESCKIVWDLFGDDARGQLFREQFLPRLRVFHQQVNLTDLDDLIQQEIQKILGNTVSRDVAENITGFVIKEMEMWTKKNKGECVRRGSRLLEHAVGAEFRREALEMEGRLRFAEEHYALLQKVFQDTLRGRPPRLLKLLVQGVQRGVRAAKLLQILEVDEFHDKWTYVDDVIMEIFPCSILKDVCRNFEIIVLDTELYSNEEKIKELMSALKNDKCVIKFVESDSYEFLKDGFKDVWTLQQLDRKHLERSLDSFISFQGKLIIVKNLEVIWKEMRSGIDGKLLEELGRMRPKFGKDLFANQERVMPRRLSHYNTVAARVLIDEEALRGGRLALQGFPKGLLREAALRVGLLDATNDEDSVIKSNARWRILNSEGEPSLKMSEKLLESLAKEKSASSLHWLEFISGSCLDDACIIWKASYGRTDAIRAHVVPMTQDCNGGNPLCIHSAPMSLKDLKKALLIGISGNGKTTILSNIAMRLKKDDPVHWVVVVKLLQHRDLLRKWSAENVVTEDHVTELLATAAGAETGSARRFLECALWRTCAVSVLVDGVDEVVADFKELTLRLLHLLLNKTPLRRVWISSRPEMEMALRRLVQSPPLALEPLTREEQCQFLVTHSSFSSTRDKQRRVEEMVNLMSEKVGDLMTTPQHLRMVADVFSASCRQDPGLRGNFTMLNLFRGLMKQKRKQAEMKYALDRGKCDGDDEPGSSGNSSGSMPFSRR